MTIVPCLADINDNLVREQAMASSSTDGGGSSKPSEFSRQKIKIQARHCLLTLILSSATVQQ
jgi:hypothetical protein